MDGSQVSRIVRFASRMFGSLDAFHGAGDTYVLASPYANQTQLTVIALRPDGSVDLQFGNRGRAEIHSPWKGSKAALETMDLIAHASPVTATLVATRFGDSPMHVIRLRL